MGRKRAVSWRMRIAALVLLAALAGAGWAWWTAQHWAPPRSTFPVQGALVGAAEGAADFTALRAIGADFVYLEASQGARDRDAHFAKNLRRVRDTGLQLGVVRAYDPCVPAARQGAKFVTTVPRDGALLPPAVALARPAPGVAGAVTRAGV